MRTARINTEAMPNETAADLARAEWEAYESLLGSPDGEPFFGDEWFREMTGDEHARGAE